MVKIVWKGYMYQNNRSPFVMVNDGQILRLQAKGTGSCTLKGVLAFDDVQVVDIATIRCNDLEVRHKINTTHIHSADISGYDYIYVDVNGFDSVYGVIYGEQSEIIPEDRDIKEFRSVIIIEPYIQNIVIRKDR